MLFFQGVVVVDYGNYITCTWLGKKSATSYKTWLITCYVVSMSNIYHTEPPTCGKVVLTTSYGEMDIELWSKEAPYACRNFVQLCMEGYYDNTPIHRIIKQFMVQMVRFWNNIRVNIQKRYSQWARKLHKEKEESL